MYYIVFATDHPDRSEIRTRNKAVHTCHLNAGSETVKVLQSGPTISPTGQENGSLVVLDAKDEAAVRAFFSRDPYIRADLFASVEIRRWEWKRGNPYIHTAT
jgi:uncharacterized protein YciI